VKGEKVMKKELNGVVGYGDNDDEGYGRNVDGSVSGYKVIKES
jgi:hypothetical protein